MSVSMPRTMTRGVVYVHSTPKALCPHIQWAIEGVLGTRVAVDWTDQPAEPGLVRAELSWSGEAGTGARIASALRGWDKLRYEVTEEPSQGCDGSRWSHTPRLGIHHTWTSASGDAVINDETRDSGPAAHNIFLMRDRITRFTPPKRIVSLFTNKYLMV